MNQAKKQNRILLAVLIVTLAAAAVLLALTGSANKKKAEERSKKENTIVEKVEEAAPAKEAPSLGKEKKESEGTGLFGIPKTPDGADEKPKEEEKAEETAVMPTSSDDILPSFTAPVDGFVIKGCSLVTPVFSNTMNDYRIHTGLDFACSPGTPVCAAADGVICEVSRDPMMGVTVAIRHSGGAVTSYRGLSEESLDMTAVGQPVSAGQVIGSSGETALVESAEDDHLHFELTVNGSREDPAEYMEVRLLSEQLED